MERDEIKRIVEALLFVSDKPISIDTLRTVLKHVDAPDIKSVIDELNDEYANENRSFNIKEIAGGFQMMTNPIYSPWVASLYKRPQDKLTGPSLETLAIIAYKQPITRGEMEAIRGVNVEGVIHTLEARDLIRVRGKKDAPGKPILYGTTSDFLQHFGLKSLDELPKLKEFQEGDLDFVNAQNEHQVIDTASGQLAEGPKPLTAENALPPEIPEVASSSNGSPEEKPEEKEETSHVPQEDAQQN